MRSWFLQISSENPPEHHQKNQTYLRLMVDLGRFPDSDHQNLRIIIPSHETIFVSCIDRRTGTQFCWNLCESMVLVDLV